MFVKPGPGLTIRIPGGPRRVLHVDGQHVPDTQFWHRRLAHGDVVIAEPPKTAPMVDGERPADAGAVA